MEQAFRTACILCRRSMRPGSAFGEGRHVAAWNVAVCEPCHDENRAGLSLVRHPRLAAYFRSKGIATAADGTGLVAWPAEREAA
ncbi:hypothetical protein U8607_15335 [Methylobacterium durans]|uniref:Uncharacterized protein n=1 Tax=Methylobacterium durans TaxID=2202825 RepID=A0A2U8WAY8_9HYPH|nr:hypothetical protein [Methylobacterium durans]AWN43315.1 hypothetical protein DK389_25935 [Methylobacterium durans]MEA1833457.1 hypothetical protein [Methylobacterium durans]